MVVFQSNSVGRLLDLVLGCVGHVHLELVVSKVGVLRFAQKVVAKEGINVRSSSIPCLGGGVCKTCGF